MKFFHSGKIVDLRCLKCDVIGFSIMNKAEDESTEWICQNIVKN